MVLPAADVKIFLTASAEDRPAAAMPSWRPKGCRTAMRPCWPISLSATGKDTTRAAAPLRQAEDAIAVDTTGLSLQESFDALLETIRRKLGQ